MNRVVTVLALFSMLALHVSAVEVTVLELSRPRHLGDENVTKWEVRRPEGFNISAVFYVEGPIREARIDYMKYSGRFDDNPVKINNVTAAEMCPGWRDEWRSCNSTVDTGLIYVGRNTLSVHSGWHLFDVEYDDFMIKDLKLVVDYVQLEPKVVSSKSLSAYEVELGEAVNVSVALSNIGSKMALNVSAVDYKPSGTYLVAGSLTDFFSPLRGDDIRRFHYTIIPPDTGDYVSWPGYVVFYGPDGTRYEGALEPTSFRVIPPKPELHLLKGISDGRVTVDSAAAVELTVFNNGSVDAFNVRVRDSLPMNFTVESGSPNNSLEFLPAGSNTTFTYNMSPTSPGLYSTSALLYYEDSEGNLYWTQSNHVNVTPVKTPVSSNAGNPALMLAAVVILVIMLYIIYQRVSA